MSREKVVNGVTKLGYFYLTKKSHWVMFHGSNVAIVAKVRDVLMFHIILYLKYKHFITTFFFVSCEVSKPFNSNNNNKSWSGFCKW